MAAVGAGLFGLQLSVLEQKGLELGVFFLWLRYFGILTFLAHVLL